MADNVNVTSGAGNIIAADEVIDGSLGTVKVQYVKIMDGTLDGTLKAAVTSNGLKVDNSGVTQPINGSVSVTNFPATQPVSIATMPSTPVTGTFFQSTQPISAISLPLPSGAATSSLQTQPGVDIGDVTINNASGVSAVNIQDGGNSITVDGTITTTPPANASTNLTQIVGTAADVNSGVKSAGTLRVVLATDQPTLTNKLLVTPDSVALPANQSVNVNQMGGVATSMNTGVRDTGTQRVTIATNDLVPVTGTLTAVTAITNALPSGSNVIGHVINDTGSTTVVTGTVAVTESGTWTVQPGNTVNTTPWLVAHAPATLVVTATAATGVAVTATLPAAASNFHYITLIEVTKYFTAANAASATPLVVTTTNLPGSYAITFGQPLGTIGTTDNRLYMPNCPLKSSVIGTNTTIVCPATTGIIWRINVYYYTAV